jgi:hypothetical protein
VPRVRYRTSPRDSYLAGNDAGYLQSMLIVKLFLRRYTRLMSSSDTALRIQRG